MRFFGVRSLTICDLQGHRIKTSDAGIQSAGVHEIGWGGLDDTGAQVPTGICFCEIRTSAGADVRRPLFSGVYYQGLSTDRFKATQKMMVLNQ